MVIEIDRNAPNGPRDLAALSDIVSDWRVVRQLDTWPWPPDPAFTVSRCAPYEGPGFVWSIRDAGRLIGTVGVTDAEIGYFLAPAHWGKGVMSDVLVQAVKAAFQDPELNRITAFVWADNPGSMRVLEKQGFRRVETGTGFNKARQEALDFVRFQLIRAAKG